MDVANVFLVLRISQMHQQAHNSRQEVQPPSLPPKYIRKCRTDLDLAHQRLVDPNLESLSDTIPPPLPPGTIPPTSPDVIVYQNGTNLQHDFATHMQALNLYQSETTPPPYPLPTALTRPPSYAAHIQSRQSPCHSNSDYRKSPSSGIYSATSASSPSPITISQHSSQYQLTPRSRPMPEIQRWHHNIVMQSVKSIQVQKPILQTALAPPPFYASSIQSKIQRTVSPVTITPPNNSSIRNENINALKVTPNPNYSSIPSLTVTNHLVNFKEPETLVKPSSNLPKNEKNTATTTETTIKHQSPIPQRKQISKEKEDERKALRIRQYSPQAFKFYMEQHVENVLKSYKQRTFRRKQLEREMSKTNLSEEAQIQLRKMLNQREWVHSVK